MGSQQLNAFTLERLVPDGAQFAAHSHDEFIVSVNGLSTIQEKVRLDRQQFEVGTDAITVYNPGQVQKSQAETHTGTTWECLSVHLHPYTVTSLTGISSFEAEKPVVHSPILARTLRSAATLSEPRHVDEVLTWAVSEALYQSRIGRPRRDDEGTSLNRRDLSPVLGRMRSDLASPVDVSDLAGSLALSTDYFIRSFVKLTGMTPYAWHLQLRLREGRRLLQAGAPVGTVAAHLGFNDQSHFHRHFRAAYAQTPGKFRRRFQ